MEMSFDNKISYNKRMSAEKSFSLFVLLSPIYLLIQIILIKYNLNDMILKILFNLATLVLLSFAFINMSRRNKMVLATILIIIMLFFGLSTMINRQNFVYLKFSIERIVRICIPLLIMGLSINDFKKLVYYFSKYNVIYIIISLSIEAMYIFKIADKSGFDYMSISYEILLLVLINNLLYFVNRRKINLFFLILNFLLLVAVAARGPVMIMIGSIVLLAIHYRKNKQVSVSVYIIFAVVLFIILMAALSLLLPVIAGIFQRYGVETRLTEIVDFKNFFSSATRRTIYQFSIKKVNEKPLLGYGLFGDRYLLNEIGVIGESGKGGYVHNLFLEVFIDFGYPIGVFLLGFMVYNFSNALVKANDYKKGIMILILSIVIIKLLISSSYLISPYFYLLIGLIFKKEQKQNEGEYINNHS